MTTIHIRRLYDVGIDLPAYATSGASGLDLRSAGDAIIPYGGVRVFPTSFAIELPSGIEAQVRGRSGLAAKHGIIAHPGTIDSDYRGEIKVILINLGNQPFAVARGDRIAQLVLAPVLRVKIEEVEWLAPTARGAAGLGSTGVA